MVQNNNRSNDKWNGNGYQGKPKDIPLESFVPISNELQKMLSGNVNFSLYSPRCTTWHIKDDTVCKINDDERKGYVSYMRIQKDQSDKSFPATEIILSKRQKFMQDYFDDSVKKNNLVYFEKTVYTHTPFITGLGSGHPTETGIILDRNSGLPYLPASSVKGVCRLSYAISIANGRTEVPDSELDEYFGANDPNNAKIGQLVFMDVYPSKVPSLMVDIMNPHFPGYYGTKNDLPKENENPVPVPFLAVKPGCSFTFRCFYKPLIGQILTEEQKIKIKTDMEKMFNIAFETVGFGGKTGVGYGRFAKNEKSLTTESLPIAEKNNVIVKPKKIENYEKGTTQKATIKKLKNNQCTVVFKDNKNCGGTFQYSKKSSLKNKKVGDVITVKLLNQRSNTDYSLEYVEE